MSQPVWMAADEAEKTVNAREVRYCSVVFQIPQCALSKEVAKSSD